MLLQKPKTLLNYIKLFSTNPSSIVAEVLKEYKSETDIFTHSPSRTKPTPQFVTEAECIPISHSKEYNILYRGSSKYWFMAHYDKVTDYDLTSDLRFKREGDKIIGNFDNGIGVSFLLNLYSKFPEHNYVFTHEEEIGFDGARTMDKYIPLDAKIINLDISDDCEIKEIAPEPILYLYQTREELSKTFVKKGFKVLSARANDVMALDKRKESVSYHIQIKNMHKTNYEEASVAHIETSLTELNEIVRGFGDSEYKNKKEIEECRM